MPKKRAQGLFSRLGRLRSRIRRLKAEVTYLAQVAGKSADAHTARELKLQLRDARDQLRDVEDLLEPSSSHIDQPIGAAAEPSA
jgi:archaellum component FlaC